MLTFLLSAFVLVFVVIAAIGHVLLVRALFHGHGRVPGRGLRDRAASFRPSGSARPAV